MTHLSDCCKSNDFSSQRHLLPNSTSSRAGSAKRRRLVQGGLRTCLLSFNRPSIVQPASLKQTIRRLPNNADPILNTQGISASHLNMIPPQCQGRQDPQRYLLQHDPAPPPSTERKVSPADITSAKEERYGRGSCPLYLPRFPRKWRCRQTLSTPTYQNIFDHRHPRD